MCNSKRKIIYPAVFLVIFVLTYLALCYFVPGFRLKLDAPKAVYFAESIKSAYIIKSVASLFFASLSVSAAFWIRKRN